MTITDLEIEPATHTLKAAEGELRLPGVDRGLELIKSLSTAIQDPRSCQKVSDTPDLLKALFILTSE